MGYISDKADNLEIALKSDKAEYDAFCAGMRQVCRAVDRTAKRCAAERAAWMDDPADEQWAAYHAPASEQYPLAARVIAIRDLVKYYLSEIRASDCKFSDV